MIEDNERMASFCLIFYKVDIFYKNVK